jgi:hypothetical protein
MTRFDALLLLHFRKNNSVILLFKTIENLEEDTRFIGQFSARNEALSIVSTIRPLDLIRNISEHQVDRCVKICESDY